MGANNRLVGEGDGVREEQEAGLKRMGLTSSDANEQRKTVAIAIETGRRCRIAAVEEGKA